jgi:hypothetical protein
MAGIHGDAGAGSPNTRSALPAAMATYWCPPAWYVIGLDQIAPPV